MGKSKRNPYRWQASGNSNIFDVDLTTIYNSENSYITKRTIIILQYIKENRLVTIDDFVENIWTMIEKYIDRKKNKSNIKHFYRPLLFYGLIKEFENKLFLSAAGERFLNCLEKKKFKEAKEFFYLQLLKTSYKNNPATEGCKLNLYPFRILFSLLLDNVTITRKDFITKIPYITSIEDYENFKNNSMSPQNEYEKFYTWVISSLEKLNIFIKNDKNDDETYKIHDDYTNFISNYVKQYNNNDLFGTDNYDISYPVRKNIPRNIALKNEVLQESQGKCSINPEHKTFPTENYENYLEVHHIMPLFNNDVYEKELDITDNLMAICPNCHQSFHKSKKEHKIKLINQIIDEGYYKDGKNKFKYRYFDKYDLYEAYNIT